MVKKISAASRHKPASPAPSSSTYPPPSDDTPAMHPNEYERAVKSIVDGDHTKALKLVDDALSRHPDSALLQAILKVIHYKEASILGDCMSKIENLKKAAEFAGLALAEAPNSISCARLNVDSLLELTQMAAPTSVSDYEGVIRHCEKALMLKNPADPLDGRLGNEFASVIKKVKTRISLLGDGNSKDWLKKPVEGNSLSLIKQDFESTELELRKVISEPIPLNVKIPADDRFTNKRKNQNPKKMMSNFCTTGRVRTYWNNMDVEDRKELFTIGIEDLIAYLDKNKLAMVKEAFEEAIDFAKVTKKWKFWECCCCEERFSVSESNMDHIEDAHIALILTKNLQLAAPELVATDFAHKMLQAVLWKPVYSISASNIREYLRSSADKGSEGFNVSQWSYFDDTKRAEIMEKIRSGLQIYMQMECLASSHLTMLLTLTMNMLQNRIPRWILEDHGLHQTPHSIRLLDVPELEHVLACLEDLAGACSLRLHFERFAIEESIDNQGPCIKERIVFSPDFSCLHLDERLLRGKIDAPDDGIAVASTTTEDYGNHDAELSADSDVICYELCEGIPKIGEKWKEWTSKREPTRNTGKKLVSILETGLLGEQIMLVRKVRILRYENTLLSVERICVQEDKNRGQIPDYDPQSFESLLLKRKEELEIEGDVAIDRTSDEMEIILGILEEAQADTGISKAIQKRREHISREVCKLDLLILASKTAIELTGKKLRSVLAHDYRFIIVPLLKSFVQERLLDMVDKDAAEKSSTAAEALLAELAVDAKKSIDKGGLGSKKGEGKSKLKKKGKYHKKAKNSEGTGGSDVRHPFNPKNVEQYDISSQDELEQCEQQQEHEDAGEDIGPSNQELDEELLLDKALELQRNFEDEAKQKRLSEKAKFVVGTSAENVAEDVHVVSSKPSQDVGSSEQGQEEELQHEDQEVQREINVAPEFQRKLEDECKLKGHAEKAKIMENVAEEVPVFSSGADEIVDFGELEHEEAFQLEDEEVQRTVDKALEFYLKLEEKVKRKFLAENVAEEEELLSGDKEVQRKLDEALESYFKFENEAKRKRLAEKAKIIENVAEEVPIISYEPGVEGVGPSEQEQQGKLQRENKEGQKMVDEINFEDEAERKHLVGKAKIVENVAKDVPVISSEPGEDVGPSKEEQEEELQREGEEVQRELDETLKLQRQIENEAEHKELDEQDMKVGGPREKNVLRCFCCRLQ